MKAKKISFAMVITIVMSGNVHFCTSKTNDESIILDKKEVLEDTVWFSYNLLKDTSFIFKNFDTPINLDSINDKTDHSVFSKITEQENFKGNNSMSVYNEDYKNNSMMVISNAGKFAFKSNTYYYLIYSNFYYNCNPCVNYISLYQLSPTGKVIRIPIGYQASESPICLGDFNNDGNLDFANWDFNNNVSFYTLNGDKFIKDKKYNIVMKSMGFSEFYVDTTKSNWPNIKWD